MFADIDASSIVSLIGKPVWVFTEARKFNRNGRIYTASNVRNAIYKGSIQTIQIETVPVSQGPSKGWLPACFANVAVSIPDENGVSKYGKRVLGAYFIADRFSNGFVQDVSRLVEPINRNRTDRFEIRVCDTNTPLVLAVPAVSAQAAPVNINVGITIKKTR